MPSPPQPARPRRRNRSLLREQLLEWLRGTDAHPTAEQIHRALQPALPQLSLATVYRNLEVLGDEGRLDAVAGSGLARRYDANPVPHHHFVCELCGSIRDVYAPRPQDLARRLAREQGLRARSARIDFHGRCPDCLQSPEAPGPEGGPVPITETGE